jgi:HrpA-like RNA helicase
LWGGWFGTAAAVEDTHFHLFPPFWTTGKSTQVPQFILDANPTCRMVVTQPRRLSAIALAERVAEEQCQEGGAGDWIGYQVRLESALSSHTQLLFLTPGVLLRQMQSSPHLIEYTHIVMDEVHERDKYQEFLLIVLRDLLPVRPDLRLILMSATLQTMTLVEYFTARGAPPALVEMEGRMFPVQEYFLEHVLEMTGYVDATTGYDGGARVEEELAKWMRTGPYAGEDNHRHPTSNTTTATMVSNVTLQCAMCGKRGFGDAVELGAHIALCDGILDSEDDEDAAGEQHVDGNAAYSTVQQPTAAPETDTKEDKKWDGVSPFDFLVSDVDDKVTDEKDALLNQYQTMHDDETVDNFLLLEVIQYIVKCSYGDGGILVFLPGWQEISEFANMLEGTSPFRDRSKYLVLPLHSGIPSRDQRRVLQRPPKGVRKIVLSTNIAETRSVSDDAAMCFMWFLSYARLTCRSFLFFTSL